MYLLKTVYVDKQNNKIVVEDGIKILEVGIKGIDSFILTKPNFWWKTFVNFINGMEYSKLPDADGNYVLLPYVNKYFVSEGFNGKILKFDVDEYKPNQKEGYIVFFEATKDVNIEAKGEKLYYDSYDIVVLLKEGDFIIFEGMNETVHYENQIVKLGKMQIINNELIINEKS